MAHMLESDDNMISVAAVPWHRLGLVLREAPTAADAIRMAGLDWNVSLRDLQLSDGAPVDAKIARAIVRDTDSKVLGVCGAKWRPFQNAKAFAFFEPWLASGAAKIETCGSLRGGQIVWILARIAAGDETIVERANDRIVPFVLLSNAHDGTQSVRSGFSAVRVVCANTLAMAHNAGESSLIRVRHSASVDQAMEQIRGTMDLAHREFRATADVMRQLAARGCKEKDLRRYVLEVFEPIAAAAERAASDKRAIVGASGIGAQILADAEQGIGRRLMAEIVPLFESGNGNDADGVRGTWWAAYNAVTHYLTHTRGRSDDTRRASLWFGEGAKLNARALTVARQLAAA